MTRITENWRLRIIKLNPLIVRLKDGTKWKLWNGKWSCVPNEIKPIVWEHCRVSP